MDKDSQFDDETAALSQKDVRAALAAPQVTFR